MMEKLNKRSFVRKRWCSVLTFPSSYPMLVWAKGSQCAGHHPLSWPQELSIAPLSKLQASFLRGTLDHNSQLCNHFLFGVLRKQYLAEQLHGTVRWKPWMTEDTPFRILTSYPFLKHKTLDTKLWSLYFGIIFSYIPLGFGLYAWRENISFFQCGCLDLHLHPIHTHWDIKPWKEDEGNEKHI